MCIHCINKILIVYSFKFLSTRLEFNWYLSIRLSFFLRLLEVYVHVFRNTLTIEIENYVHTWYRIKHESVPWVSSGLEIAYWVPETIVGVRFGAFEPAKAVDIGSLWESEARHTLYEFQIKFTPSSCTKHTHTHARTHVCRIKHCSSYSCSFINVWRGCCEGPKDCSSPTRNFPTSRQKILWLSAVLTTATMAAIGSNYA